MAMRRVPDLLIERIALGELPEAEARRLMEDPEVARRVRELERSNREILAAYPVEEMGRRIAGRLESLQSAQGASNHGGSERRPLFGLPRFVPVAGLAGAVIAAGLVLAVLLPGGFTAARETTVTVSGETRLKGLKPRLVVYQRTASGAETLRENDAVRQSDVLQLGYVAAARAYGVILSIDGRGVVTLHFPVGSTGAGELEREGESLLPFAYELDDAPGFERFFFVTGPEPFAVDSVLEAAERLAADPEQARQAPLILPGELEQVSMMLKKTAAVR